MEGVLHRSAVLTVKHVEHGTGRRAVPGDRRRLLEKGDRNTFSIARPDLYATRRQWRGL